MRPPLRPLFLLLSLAFLPSTPALALQPEPEASDVVQEFLDYLLKPGTDISTDAAARQKWLSADLRARFDAATQAVVEARKRPGVDGPDPSVPDNGTFLDSWDLPTACRAERSVVEHDGVTVRVVCDWGLETNYPGLKREAEVTTVKEGGVWRIRNIVLHTNAYAGESNVSALLETLRRDAENAGR